MNNMLSLSKDIITNSVQVLVLENTQENHYKYYHLSRNKTDHSYLAQWGRIGNKAQSKVYEVPRAKFNLDYVGEAMYIKMQEKLKKGYILKTYKTFGDHSSGYEEFMLYLKENDTDIDNLLFD